MKKRNLLLIAGALFAMSGMAQYNNGYFIINEGQYGSEPGLLNYYSSETNELSTKVYQDANNGSTLGMTAEFGARADGKLFICSKQNFGAGGRLVVADANTLEMMANYVEIDGNADTRAVEAVVEANMFFVGTNMGVYAYDLSTLEPVGLVEGTAIEGSAYSPGSGDMVSHGGYLYVATPDGVMVIDPVDNVLVTTVAIANTVSVFEVNGKVYAAANSCTWGTPSQSDTEQFVLINEDFTAGTVYVVPMASSNFWFTPKPCKPVEIMGENAIVYSPGEGTKYLCKYDFSTGEFTEKFIEFEGRQQMYGHVLASDLENGDLLVCTFQGYSSTNYWFNIYDGKTGEQKNSLKMPAHYWFPSQIIKAKDSGSPTGIKDLTVKEKEVAGVMYYNVTGQMSRNPFDGINIVQTRYTDGTTSTEKVMF